MHGSRSWCSRWRTGVRHGAAVPYNRGMKMLAVSLLLVFSAGTVDAEVPIGPRIRLRAPAGARVRDLPSQPNQCFVLQSLDGTEMYVSNDGECLHASAPASTFKVPHALIALETGVVKDPFALVKWDGTKKPFPVFERDHSLDSALKSSVFWFFQKTAAAIGRKRMLANLEKIGYGSDRYEGEQTAFWVNGDLEISPAEQLDFLRRMFRYELPVKRANVDIVKRALLMPEGVITNAAGRHPFALSWPKGTRLIAKTGNTRVRGERVSWLIGHLTSNGREYVFVSRLRAPEAQDVPTIAGAEVARKHLNAIAAQRR